MSGPAMSPQHVIRSLSIFEQVPCKRDIRKRFQRWHVLAPAERGCLRENEGASRAPVDDHAAAGAATQRFTS